MAKEKEVVEESEAKVAFRALIEKYAKQNPVKYEKKKAELEAKLAKL
jgi:hypothetical protein